MKFKIREFDEQKDSANFYKYSFNTLVSIKGLPPVMSRAEYYDMMVQIVQDYINQLEKNKIFVAEDESGTYLGHIWISLKDELEIWELKPYFWLQNITIVKGFRRKGIATKLMIHAEEWIKNQGYDQIGLHVDGKNSNAIQLYKKFHYSVYQTQLYKQINLLNSINDSELKITQCKADDEYLKVQNFLYLDLREKINSSVSTSEINNRISALLKNLRDNDEDHLYIITNQTDDTLGYFILSQAEMKFKKTAYIRVFRIHKQADYERFVKVMLAFTEQWANDHQIALIETLVGSLTSSQLKFLKAVGFLEFGYFMVKNSIN